MLMNKKAAGWKVFRWTIITIFLLLTVIPIIIVVMTSFKNQKDIFVSSYKWLFVPVVKNYVNAFATGEFPRYFLNSIFITLVATAATVILGTLAAYGLISFKLKGSKGIANIFLLGKLVPSITILLPFFIILAKMNIIGTYVGPIMADIALNLPFVVWLMISFIKDVPPDLSSAAEIDGCSKMQAFWHVIFPILTPAIASAGILSMQFSWNEFMFALQLTNMDTATLPVGISKFVGAVSIDWGKSCAAATVTMAPIIIMGFIAQKYLVMGITMGSVKG
jgi:multiple sugar transport system permease protein